MSSTLPLISVIIPAYNTEAYLARCLDSVLAQTLTDFELLLIDDGSTDGTAAIADRYAEADNRVKVIHKENGGVSSARNRGLEVAQGEFFTFVDADDRVRPTYLEKLYRLMVCMEADISIVSWVDDYGLPEGGTSAPAPDVRYTQEEITDLKLLSSSCMRMFRRSSVPDLRFAEDIYYGEDTLFAVQSFYGRRGNTIVYSSEELYINNCANARSATAQRFHSGYMSRLNACRNVRQAVESYPVIRPAADRLLAYSIWDLYRLMLLSGGKKKFPNETQELRRQAKVDRKLLRQCLSTKARFMFWLARHNEFLALCLIRFLHKDKNTRKGDIQS